MKKPLDILPYVIVPFYKRIESLDFKKINGLNSSQKINFLLREFGKNILEAPKLFAYLYAAALLLETIISAVIWSYFIVSAASIIIAAYPAMYLMSYLKTTSKSQDSDPENTTSTLDKENQPPTFLDEAAWASVDAPPQYTAQQEGEVEEEINTTSMFLITQLILQAGKKISLFQISQFASISGMNTGEKPTVDEERTTTAQSPSTYESASLPKINTNSAAFVRDENGDGDITPTAENPWGSPIRNSSSFAFASPYATSNVWEEPINPNSPTYR